MVSYYGRLSSEVYNLDKPVGHSFGDIEFYQERLFSCEGKVLEPATGTGRILIPLLEAGFDVEGFDSSVEMLTVCRDNCEVRGLAPKLFEANMESFNLDSRYDAIILPAGTFLLIDDRERSINTLRNFHHHLSDGGKLILDLFLQTDVSIGKVTTRTWECENGNLITLQSSVIQVDYLNQYTVSHGRYEKWRNGVLIQTELEPFPLRWYGIEEFRMILKEVGFEDIVISADYQYGQYPENAGQVITFEAKAKKR
ncbi:Methyltransferase domain-containing protein [Mesobacillus persicus]|uniref:Methyltransferase domain-containing protein n=1 Tax=Mesobacillus persicus TaxID=930146 RepID=A0A1H7VT05_9BACI|nr:class I SAM-dependent methyltransferase [Mesobacillus persicus]SEM12290.1 Methyltransferase domain-containing protein [Mesobacillus persicus]